MSTIPPYQICMVSSGGEIRNSIAALPQYVAISRPLPHISLVPRPPKDRDEAEQPTCAVSDFT